MRFKMSFKFSNVESEHEHKFTHQITDTLSRVANENERLHVTCGAGEMQVT